MLSPPLRQQRRREDYRELWQTQAGAYPDHQFLYMGPLLTPQEGSTACSESTLSHHWVIKLPPWTLGHHYDYRPTVSLRTVTPHHLSFHWLERIYSEKNNPGSIWTEWFLNLFLIQPPRPLGGIQRTIHFPDWNSTGLGIEVPIVD